MIGIKSILAKLFKTKVKSQPQPQPETELHRAKGSLVVIRGAYEFHAGAVALMRVETPSVTEEVVYYPEDSQEFFNDLTSSLDSQSNIILQINKNPETLGLSRNSSGALRISPVVLLGQE